MKRLAVLFAVLLAWDASANCIEPNNCITGGSGSAGSGNFEYSRGGCSASGGCSDSNGGMWFMESFWANSPGVQHAGFLTFQTNTANTTSTVAQAISPVESSPAATAISATIATSNCGAALTGSTDKWCTTISNAVPDSFDTRMCRYSNTPFAVCTVTGGPGTCGTLIASADTPETYIVRYPIGGTGTDYLYTPMMITGYANGCNAVNGATTALTVQPFHAEGANKLIGVGASIQPAMGDTIHPTAYYGGYLAQKALLARVTEAYIPKSNIANNNDTLADCTAVNGGVSTETLIPWDPSKAPYLGSWSSVRGSACKHAATGAAILTFPQKTVTPGVWYDERIWIGSSDPGTSPLVEVLDQAGTPLVGNVLFSIDTRGENYFSNLFYGATPAEKQLGGWSLLKIRFYVGYDTTTTALRVNFGTGATTTYWDEHFLYPSPDQSDNSVRMFDASAVFDAPHQQVGNFVIPDGSYRVLIAADSRGGTTLLKTALETAAPYLRPGLTMNITEDTVLGRQIGDLDSDLVAVDPVCNPECWNSVEKRAYVKNQQFDYAIVLMSVNDFSSVGSNGVAARVMDMARVFKEAGTQVLWFEEPPTRGNGEWTGLGEATVAPCFTDFGLTGQGCGRSMQRAIWSLIRGGAFN